MTAKRSLSRRQQRKRSLRKRLLKKLLPRKHQLTKLLTHRKKLQKLRMSNQRRQLHQLFLPQLFHLLAQLPAPPLLRSLLQCVQLHPLRQQRQLHLQKHLLHQ